jgi:predicted DNA-binding transcriptional regulator AlpA
MTPMDKLISIAKAAEMLGCSPSKVYALERSGLLEFKKLGPRATRVSEIAVLQLIANAQNHSPMKSPPVMHHRLRVPEAARYLGVTVHKLYHMRSRGDGPAFIKIGHQIVYDTRELDSWLEAKTHRSIAAQQEAG